MSRQMGRVEEEEQSAAWRARRRGARTGEAWAFGDTPAADLACVIVAGFAARRITITRAQSRELPVEIRS